MLDRVPGLRPLRAARAPVAWAPATSAALDDDVALAPALDRADAGAFVAELPDGLDTVLGSRAGRPRSVRGPVAAHRGRPWPHPAHRRVLLVLDEPTVSMDAATERRLLERCIADARAMAAERGTVVVFVSHRYATARLADHIVVLDHGRVLEAGTMPN